MVVFGLCQQCVPGAPACGFGVAGWQQISCGKHRASHQADIRIDGNTLQIWNSEELLKTVLRTSTIEVKKPAAGAS